MNHRPRPRAGGSPGGGWRAHVVAQEEAGRTVEEILRGPLGLSGRMLQRLTRARGIRLNGRPGHLSRKVRAGDRVEARADAPAAGTLPPVEMELAVIHEDAQLLVVDKPAGLVVHPTRAEHTRTLAHGVAAHLTTRGGAAAVHPVHRIDRGTSGLVVFAKTPASHAALDRDLREGRVRRVYQAVAEGAMEGEEGVVEAPTGAHPRRRELRAVRPDGAPARTRWRVLERLRGATLLEVELESGRTHQIRVHLAHSGHPVYGDRDYGAAESFERPALHAAELTLPHPSGGEPLHLRAPLPDELRALIAGLGGGA
jgi:23S rRNA pseudouridine1911/1915/1917 synthase